MGRGTIANEHSLQQDLFVRFEFLLSPSNDSVFFQPLLQALLFPHISEDFLQEELTLLNGEWQVVDVETRGFGRLGVFRQEDVAVPETSHGINLLFPQEPFDTFVLGECIVLVPVESVLTIPALVSLIVERYVPESAIELVLAPVFTEIRHVLRLALYRSVAPCL